MDIKTYFETPKNFHQRQYEAVRAFLYEDKPASEIAAKFGYTTQTIYSIVKDFRALFKANKLDDYLGGGFRAGELWIIGAETSVGKTAFALSIIANMSLFYDYKVALLSLEMTETEVINRLISITSNIDLKTIRSFDFEKDTPVYNKYLQYLSKHKNSKLYIDDDSSLSEIGLYAKAKLLKEKYDINILFIDYLQRMRTNNKEQSRNYELGKITWQAKNIAKDFNITVIMLSQLNRAVKDNSKDYRPTLSNLRDSGEIEQDADGVLLIHRPERHGIKEFADGEIAEGKARIIIAKQRNGTVNTAVTLDFIHERAKYSEPKIENENHF
jgi:replicative DNA helicase